MNESISRAAGASFGQEMPPEAMEELIRSLGRTPRQRTTLYGDAPAERRAASFGAAAAVRADQHPGPQVRARRGGVSYFSSARAISSHSLSSAVGRRRLAGALVPAAGVMQVALDPVQIGMRPGALFVGVGLRAAMRPVPIALGLPP